MSDIIQNNSDKKKLNIDCNKNNKYKLVDLRSIKDLEELFLKLKVHQTQVAVE